MIAVGMLILLLPGYGVASWGWCLLRGYDVPFLDWFDPLHPFEWPAGGPGLIPDTQLMPSSSAAAAQTTAATGPASSSPGAGNSPGSGTAGLSEASAGPLLAGPPGAHPARQPWQPGPPPRRRGLARRRP